MDGTCTECQTPMVSAWTWGTCTDAERAEWREDGYAPAGRRGRCARCYARHRRAERVQASPGATRKHHGPIQADSLRRRELRRQRRAQAA